LNLLGNGLRNQKLSDKICSCLLHGSKAEKEARSCMLWLKSLRGGRESSICFHAENEEHIFGECNPICTHKMTQEVKITTTLDLVM